MSKPMPVKNINDWRPLRYRALPIHVGIRDVYTCSVAGTANVAEGRIRLRLLGEFSVEAPDGRQIAIASKKSRGVLAYLALSRGKKSSREQVASLFWPDSGEKEARQSLRQCLSALRKSLSCASEACINSEGGHLALAPELFDVDVDLVMDGLSSNDKSRAYNGARHAKGVLLPNHVFGDEAVDDWLRDERVRLQDASRRLLFRCVEQHAGDHESVADLYRLLLELDPSCEEAHRGLMMTYADIGQRSSALAQYQACADALARHMDALPSEATRKSYEELRQAGAPTAEASTTREAAPTLPLPSKPAIAVLAFANLSGDESQEYLSDGISDDITTFLSQFSSLYVMSRTTSVAFKGRGLSVPEIGRQLGVHYVLEGSVRLAGNRIRVSVRLAEAEHGGQVWANRYDGTLDDIFGFQDDIAQRIVATTAGRIEAEALDRARRKTTTELSAYDFVLRGKYHHHRCTPEDSDTAVQMFQQALDCDPEWPLAKGWLVCAMGRAAGFGHTRTKWMNSNSYEDLMATGLSIIKEAVATDEEESECLRLLGEVQLFHRNYEEAENLLRRAHQFNPNDDRIHSQLSAFLTYTEQPEEAVRFARLAIRLNPYHPGFYRFNLGRALMCLGLYEEAAQEIAAASPSQNHWRPYLAGCYAALGKDQEAAAVTKAILQAEPEFSLAYLKATMLFRSQERLEHLLGLMERANLPRESS